VTEELDQVLIKLDLEKLKAVAERFGIDCSTCEQKEEFVRSISDSQKVTVQEIQSQFQMDQQDPSEEGDTMPGFENAEKLLNETKAKFESGDYNASIDKATEAMSAGATALSSLLGMGLSYAVQSSEKLISDLKDMDIDSSGVEEVLNNARQSLESKDFGQASNIVNQLKESIYDLSQKQGEKIVELLNSTQTTIDNIKEMGANVLEAEGKLKVARDQANAGAFTQALGTMGESENLANSAKETRITEIKDTIKKAETAVDEAKYVNAPVSESEGLLEEAKGAFSSEEYRVAFDKAEKATASANTAKEDQINRVMRLQEKMTAGAVPMEVEEPKVEAETPSEETTFVEESQPEPEAQPEVAEEPQAEEPATQEPVAEEPKESPADTEKVCPKCEGEPTYVDQYDKWFCYTCNEYIEPKDKEAEIKKEEAPAESAKAELDMICGKCEGDATWVEQYDRWFCYTCNEYIEPKKKEVAEKKEEPAAAAAPDAKAELDMMCGKCKGDATWVEQYDKWFCYTCNEYIEPKKKEAVAKKEAPTAEGVCPKCEGEPTYVEQYDRHFCYTCNEYVTPTKKKAEVKKEVKPQPTETKKVCPKCEGEPTYVEQYKRYYCYDCGDYVEPKKKEVAAKSKNACSTCGKEATYVEQYKRHYCYDCNKYV
jgi:hypothetical protein